MNFSKEYLIELSNKTHFIKDTLEKMLRLSRILEFLNNDEFFKDKFALKGGTAINLTVVELPRLSIDIDLDFVENCTKEEIALIRPQINENLTKYMIKEGYFQSAPLKEYYALQSFMFGYINNANNIDNIKIEINYIDRCHVLPLEHKKIICKWLNESFEILTLNTIELYASKINALLSRFAPRDLYDINIMIINNVIQDEEMLKKCLIFYNMIGGNQNIDSLAYEGIDKINYFKYKTQLKPVISKNENFNLIEAKKNVISFLKKLIVINDNEQKFIDEFKKRVYKPELLFDNELEIYNAKCHPMALWRCNKK